MSNQRSVRKAKHKVKIFKMPRVAETGLRAKISKGPVKKPVKKKPGREK